MVLESAQAGENSWALIVNVKYDSKSIDGLPWDKYMGIAATLHLPYFSSKPPNTIFAVLTLCDDKLYCVQVGGRTNWLFDPFTPRAWHVITIYESPSGQWGFKTTLVLSSQG
jgi:hypothetical protein